MAGSNQNRIAPIYSHGQRFDGPHGLPSVRGLQTGPGLPIWIDGAAEPCIAMNYFLKQAVANTTGVCVFKIEFNGGLLTNGQPPADEWIDASDAFPTFYTLYYPANLGANQHDRGAKTLEIAEPMWRTNIVEITPGLELFSYVPCIRIEGKWFQAAYPPNESMYPSLTSTT